MATNSHFELIKNQVEKDFDDIEVLGWIQNKIDVLDSTHLGLDLKDNQIENLNLCQKRF